MLDYAFNRSSYAAALPPGAAIKTTTQGNAIDLLSVNNGCNSLTFIVMAGTITDGTHAFTLQDSPDQNTWNNVNAPYFQIGPGGNIFTSATQLGTTLKFGYLGNPGGASRYVRLVATVNGATNGGAYVAMAELGLGSQLPAA